MKIRSVITALTAFTLLSGCSAPSEKEPLSLWVVPDLHYLSPSLFREDAVSFQKLLSSNDGKMIERMPEILAEIRALALKEKLILFLCLAI